MSKTLNPTIICNIYTLQEIKDKVVFYQSIVDGTASNKMYDKDSSQGRQKVETQDVDKVVPILASWMKALELKQGMGGPRVFNINYQGHN